MHHVVVGPGEAEEALEDLFGQHTFGVLGTLVGHEPVDEGVRGRLHDYTGEGGVEKVRVRGNALLEAFLAEIGQKTEAVVGLRVGDA